MVLGNHDGLSAAVTANSARVNLTLLPVLNTLPPVNAAGLGVLITV